MSMSVYPLFLVLDREGILNAYATEAILEADLRINRRNGDPARQVFKLQPGGLGAVRYEPSPEFAEFTEPLENLCERHKREALPAPSRSTCPSCQTEQRAAHATKSAG